MYEDYVQLEAIWYYFARFVIPLYIAESLYIFSFPKRKYWKPLFLSFSALFFSLSLVVVYFDFDFKVGWFRIIFFLIFLLSLIPMFSAYSLKPKQIILFALSAYAIQNLGDNLSSLIIFLTNLSAKKYELYQCLIYIGVYIICYVLYYLFFVKKLKKDVDISVAVRGNFTYLMTVATLIIVYVISMFAQSTSDFVGFVSSRIYAMIACLFLILTHYNTYYRKRLQSQNNMLEQVIYNENEKYKQSKKNMDLINMRIHDLKHQVEGLKELAISNQEKIALDNLENELRIYDNTLETGNATIDFIVAEKSLYCKKHEIRFSSLIDGEKLCFMSNVDIYSFFENALDNAIEAVLKAEKPKRTITINVVSKGNYLTIHVENFCSEEIDFFEGLPITKKDKTYHGFGTRSMQKVVKKYNGTIVFKYKENVFSVNAIIPLNNHNTSI